MKRDDRQIEAKFNEIFISHYQKILAFTIAKIGRRNDNYKDCVQDTFKILFDKMKSGEKIENPSAWLYRTVNNFVKKNYDFACKQRDRNISLDECSVNICLHDTMEELIERYITEKDVDYKKVLDGIFDALSKDEKKLYELHYVKKNTIKTTADALDLSETAVSTRVYRLRNKITQLVKTNLEYEYTK